MTCFAIFVHQMQMVYGNGIGAEFRTVLNLKNICCLEVLYQSANLLSRDAFQLKERDASTPWFGFNYVIGGGKPPECGLRDTLSANCV